ncbi:MAG: hypothetical protein IKV74_02040 [Clostridia bacterium]|nr:hypothetical protein [Clostridia bacterium]
MKKGLCLMLALVLLACGISAIPASAATAPVPNGFQLSIADNGTVSNGVTSNVYILSEKNGVPTIGTDAESGNKYLNITKTENKALEISMRNDAVAGNQVGMFWKYYWNYASGATHDLSFTWEFLVRMPEMNPTPNDFANVFGYRADKGGFGFRIGNTEGQLVFGNGKTSSAYNGTELVTINFPMEANEWYHCILTYDHTSKIANAYVNGEAIKGPDNTTDIEVDWFVAASYMWSSRGMGIGIAPEYTSVVFGSDIGIYNFSEYSVDASEAALLWAQADNQWKLTPAQPTPSAAPTAAPTQAPTVAPTVAPTQAPTQAPTEAPTQAPVVPQPPTGDTGVMIACLVLLAGAGVVLFVRKRKITE